MPDITAHLPLSALQPFFDNARGDGNITDAWRRQYFRNLERIVHPALIAFFKELKAEGRFSPIPNSEGYSCRLWDAWNNAARLDLATAPAEEISAKLDSLAQRFAHSLVFNIVYPYEKVLESKDAVAIAAFDKADPYTEETQKFSKGDFPFAFSHENCQRTGLPLILQVADWTPRGKCIIGQQVVDVPITTPEAMQETVFELKTGNLLVADWFRIEAFTKQVRKKSFDLNSRKGRDEQTRYLAEKFGIVSVTSYSSPGIFQAGNQVLGGFFNDEEGDVPAGYRHIGNVCTDLWAASFVEYETLVALVAKDNPDSAKEIVDAYIEEHKGGVYGLHQITVEPGTYYLYHFAENEEYAGRAKQDGLQLDAGDIEPFFVFSQTRLLPDRTA